MTEVSIRFEIAAAHRLYRYDGPCRNLHGHNYEVNVTVVGPVDEVSGMVIDFRDLKAAAREAVIDPFDHKTILEVDDPLIEVLREYTPLATIPMAPTAENLAHIFAKMLHQVLSVYRIRVDVYETRDNCATERL